MSKNGSLKAELLAKMQAEMSEFEKHIAKTPAVFQHDYDDELLARKNIINVVSSTELSDKVLKSLLTAAFPTETLLNCLTRADGVSREELGKEIKAFAERKPSILQRLRENIPSPKLKKHKNKEQEISI